MVTADWDGAIRFPAAMPSTTVRRFASCVTIDCAADLLQPAFTIGGNLLQQNATTPCRLGAAPTGWRQPATPTAAP